MSMIFEFQVWFCQWCGRDLREGPFEEAAKHLTHHLEEVREAHPEVSDDQMELDRLLTDEKRPLPPFCSSERPIPKDLGEGPESDDEMGNPSNK